MTRISYLVSISPLLLMCACQKKEQAAAEPPTATINITTPQPGQDVRRGTVLLIQAQIKGDVNLHGYEVFIVEKRTLDTVFKTDNHAHSKELQVNESWTDTLSQVADLDVYVRTEINHEGTSVARSASVTSKP